MHLTAQRSNIQCYVTKDASQAQLSQAGSQTQLSAEHQSQQNKNTHMKIMQETFSYAGTLNTAIGFADKPG